MYKSQITELALVNPRRGLFDWLPPSFKVWWKSKLAPYFNLPAYHVIIPPAAQHPAWYLGCQPNESLLTPLSQQAAHLIIVNLLADRERILSDHFAQLNDCTVEFQRCPWFDHTVLNLTTGKNQNVVAYQKWQEQLAQAFLTRQNDTIFYCHCMAGKSRSLVTTLAFLYLFPEPLQLFDFAAWPVAMAQKVPAELKARLAHTSPLLYDLWRYIRLRRPQVDALTSLDGDQAGFVGLLALNHIAQRIEQDDIIAQFPAMLPEFGLSLVAPLDVAFRDADDLTCQWQNLSKLNAWCHAHGENLWQGMIQPLGEPLAQCYQRMQDFTWRVAQLPLRSQLHLALMIHHVAGSEDQPLINWAKQFLVTLSWQHKELTVGDQIARFMEMPDSLGLRDACHLVDRLFGGGRLDRHNNLVLLAELMRGLNYPKVLFDYLMKRYRQSVQPEEVKRFYEQ